MLARIHYLSLALWPSRQLSGFPSDERRNLRGAMITRVSGRSAYAFLDGHSGGDSGDCRQSCPVRLLLNRNKGIVIRALLGHGYNSQQVSLWWNEASKSSGGPTEVPHARLHARSLPLRFDVPFCRKTFAIARNVLFTSRHTAVIFMTAERTRARSAFVVPTQLGEPPSGSQRYKIGPSSHRPLKRVVVSSHQGSEAMGRCSSSAYPSIMDSSWSPVQWDVLVRKI